MEPKEFKIEKFDARKNIFIEASAGTGKTYTIQQIVAKLVAGDAQNKVAPCGLDKIAIVTYTEKAAGELKDRIRKKLEEVVETKKLDKDDETRLDEATLEHFRRELNEVDGAAIFTIHSFCQKVLSEKAFAAGQPLSLSFADDSDAAAFLERWLRDTLSNDADFQAFYNEDEKFLNNIRRDFCDAAKKLYLGKNYEFDKSIAQVLVDETDERQVSYKNKILAFLKAWQKDKETRKVQTYDDMIRGVREALRTNPSPLKEMLQAQYKYAIIDEFQDTNQRQWDIFKSVFMDDEHSIFVVGDPKQSIFSFQGADISVYQRAKDEILKSGGEAFSLTDNWRSSEKMIDACNALFNCDFFDPKSEIDFKDSSYPKNNKSSDAEFDGEPTKTVWIMDEIEGDKDEAAEAFAKIAAEKIVECCSASKTNPAETRLRVYKKNQNGEKEIQNVSFGDFAVLARTRSEMAYIEKVFNQFGIPYTRYKDANLFSGRECLQWISLFAAINAPDFSGKNLALLRATLITDFFGASIFDAEDEKYESPACAERQLIFAWRRLAQEGQWARLIEAIYGGTKVEEQLSKLDRLASLSKLRQIANYSIEYLYDNDGSLDGLIKHLTRLNNNDADADGEDGNLVAKSVDFDSVQIMTVHAAKGLEFPVVVSLAGINQETSTVPWVYTYHERGDKNKKIVVFGQDTKKAKKNQKVARDNQFTERFYEFQRLFYVAYTRATSLMILPRFAFWNTNRGKLLPFLKKTFDKFCAENEEQFETVACYGKLSSESVRAILNKQKNEEWQGSETQQKEVAKKLAAKIPALRIYTHSYTSLSHGANDAAEAAEIDDDARRDKEDGTSETQDLSAFDKDGTAVDADYAEKNPPALSERYPRGARLGTAVHEVFEKADFEAAGAHGDFEAAAADENLKKLIGECFERRTIHIDENDSQNIRKQTAGFVWNALNATLSEIQGGRATGKTFRLVSLKGGDKIAEAEFNLNPFESWMKNFFTGFMDLVFVREIGGEKAYSILDWKTDSFDDDSDYCDAAALKSAADSKYAIQRVLYSYCLIKWLAQFYGGSEAEIFDRHFGGIYYVFVRGCAAGTPNGVYQHTWRSWRELEGAFNFIRGQLNLQRDSRAGYRVKPDNGNDGGQTNGEKHNE